MNDCATQKMRFETQTALALEAAFDGGRITSDGGLVWLAEADEELGLCEAISEHIPEWRKRKGLHSLTSLVRPRVFQIACGYEDQNDSNSLREDPLLKVVCGSLPESGSGKLAHLLAPGERGGRSLLPADLPGPLRTLSEGAGQAEHSTEGAFGLRRDRRPHPWRAGRKLLPRLLPTAHLPSSFDLRRPEWALDHGALKGGQHPCTETCWSWKFSPTKRSLTGQLLLRSRGWLWRRPGA